MCTCFIYFVHDMCFMSYLYVAKSSFDAYSEIFTITL